MAEDRVLDLKTQKKLRLLYVDTLSMIMGNIKKIRRNSLTYQDVWETAKKLKEKSNNIVRIIDKHKEVE